MQSNAASDIDFLHSSQSHALHAMWKSQTPCLLTISLNAAQHKKLRTQLGHAMQSAECFESPLEAQFRLRQAARRIARDVFGARLLGTARKHLASGGVIVWDGLPLCEPRPSDSEGDALTFGQALAAVIAQATTHSFGFIQEDAGRYFQRLYPVEGLVNSGKTIAPLLPHVDNCMLAPSAQPQVIHLVCVNNDARAATNFFTIDAVLRGLLDGFDARVIDRLFEPAYLTALSNSFAADPSDKSITTRARPILYRRRNNGVPTRFLAKAYDMGVKPGLDNSAEYEHALAAFQHVLKERHDLAFWMTTLPGQAVSFNQQQLLHGRGPIVAGKHREVVRAYGRFGFSKLQARLGRLPPNYVFDGIRLVDR